MLTNIENRLEELFEIIETMPQDKVEAAEKVGVPSGFSIAKLHHKHAYQTTFYPLQALNAIIHFISRQSDAHYLDFKIDS